MLKKFVLVLIAIALVAAVGCSKKTVVIDDKGTKATVDTSKANKGETEIEIKGKEGNVKISGKQGKPDNWPADMPFYPGAKVDVGTSMTGTTEAVSVSLNTKDDFAKVAEWYEKELKSAGWTAEISTSQKGSGSGAPSSNYIGVSKDNRQGAVIISDAADDKGVIIVITITPKQ